MDVVQLARERKEDKKEEEEKIFGREKNIKHGENASRIFFFKKKTVGYEQKQKIQATIKEQKKIYEHKKKPKYVESPLGRTCHIARRPHSSYMV